MKSEFQKWKFIGGFQDTRSNGEDFAITPYVSFVNVRIDCTKIYGLAITWGFYSMFIGVGFHISRSFPRFMTYE